MSRGYSLGILPKRVYLINSPLTDWRSRRYTLWWKCPYLSSHLPNLLGLNFIHVVDWLLFILSLELRPSPWNGATLCGVDLSHAQLISSMPHRPSQRFASVSQVIPKRVTLTISIKQHNFSCYQLNIQRQVSIFLQSDPCLKFQCLLRYDNLTVNPTKPNHNVDRHKVKQDMRGIVRKDIFINIHGMQ